jgi:hypothetical protein
MDWLIGHLVGDYLLQNDYLAQGKKESSVICAVHCLLYTFAIWWFTSWSMLFLSAVLVTHFLIDRWGFVKWFMRVNQQEAFSQPPFAPWSIILIDNIFHLYILFRISAALS